MADRLTDYLLKFEPKKWAGFILRIGLGLTLIYAGFDILREPDNWIGFVPQWIGGQAARGSFLYGHAAFDLALGAAIIARFYLPILSIIAFFDFAAILVFYGVDSVTFRDFGLAAMSLALFLESLPRNKTGQNPVETPKV